MYTPSNLVMNLSCESEMELTPGGTSTITINLQNQDLLESLYNVSFSLTLGDGLELISSTVLVTSSGNGIYSFLNIKDLAPDELTFSFDMVVKMNSTYSNGTNILFGTDLSMEFLASADTMPRGSYDAENEVIETREEVLAKAVKYLIYKESADAFLSGEIYTSEIIIQTAENAEIYLNELRNAFGNGIAFLGDLEITGGIIKGLENYTTIEPALNHDYYELFWQNVTIPQNMRITIHFSVKLNEKYYVQGAATGAYVTHGTQISDQLSYQVDAGSKVSKSSSITAYEVMITLVLSKSKVDIRESVKYSIYFKCNKYHGLSGVSGTLTTSDGQTLADDSTPMYFAKEISKGVTQVLWNVGAIAAETSAIVVIDGTIAENYTSTALPIYTGDEFQVNIACSALSNATGNLVTAFDAGNMYIDVPAVEKTIEGYYYRDMTPKTIETGAPGDYVKYKLTYNSADIAAPSQKIELFDFYPYFTADLENISYTYSSTNYPSRGILLVDPYGVMWYTTSIPGNQSFDMEAMAQFSLKNVTSQYYNNLFKSQISNTTDITFSERAMVAVSMGKPNLSLETGISGNDINKVKIGEVYTKTITLMNKLDGGNVTDAFSFQMTDTIPNQVTLNTESVGASVGGSSVTPVVEGNAVTVNIDKLEVGSTAVLTYSFTIDNTLAPGMILSSQTVTTLPYTQLYDDTQTNLHYDVAAVSEIKTLQSEPITFTLTADSVQKVVGDDIYYNYTVKIPAGIRLSNFYSLILIPAYHTYSGEAWLNGSSINAVYSNRTIVFPTISDINTTLRAVTYEYSVKCNINTAARSVSNPSYSIETVYANTSYVTVENNTVNVGRNLNIEINHPYIVLGVGSSVTQENYSGSLIVEENRTVYIRLYAQNNGLATANNTMCRGHIPAELAYQEFEAQSNVVKYNYDSEAQELNVTFGQIPVGQSGYIAMRALIADSAAAGTKSIITGTIDGYYNNVSSTMIYSSSSISNAEIYINSELLFTALSMYQLSGTNAAINISPVGQETQMKYLLINNSAGIDSFRITTTPIAYNMDIYVNNTYISTIGAGTSGSIEHELLNNMISGESRYIGIGYSIPEGGPHYQITVVTATSKINPLVIKSVPSTFQDP